MSALTDCPPSSQSRYPTFRTQIFIVWSCRTVVYRILPENLLRVRILASLLERNKAVGPSLLKNSLNTICLLWKDGSKCRVAKIQVLSVSVFSQVNLLVQCSLLHQGIRKVVVLRNKAKLAEKWRMGIQAFKCRSEKLGNTVDSKLCKPIAETWPYTLLWARFHV